jgi:hypothetical protein
MHFRSDQQAPPGPDVSRNPSMMTPYPKRRPGFEILLAPFLVMLLCWPAALNGGALFYYDSLSYLGSAATAFRDMFGLETPWASPSRQSPPHQSPPHQSPAHQSPLVDSPGGAHARADSGQAGPPPAAASGETEDVAVNAGRSIYYGVFLLTADVVGSLWLAIAAQAFIAILAVYMTFLVVVPYRAAHRATFITVLVIGVLSSLPFYVSYLMPDFLTGIVILAIANLIAFGARMRRWMFAVWGALLLFGLISHSSHILIAGAMIAGWALLRVMSRRTLFTVPFAVCLGALATAGVAEAVFFKITESRYAATAIRPPFLMARTISDGPGYSYLVENCASRDFRICDFIDVLPQSSDDILWSQDPKTGIYRISDPETKKQLSDQQTQFVLEVLRHDWPGQIKASLHGFAKQFAMVNLYDFSYHPSLGAHLHDKSNSEYKKKLEKTLLYKNSFPLTPVNFVVVSSTILFAIYGIVCVILLLVRRNRPSDRVSAGTGLMTIRPSSAALQHGGNDILVFVACVAGAVCLNAAVTGILSTPHDRYQARVSWLVPFLGMYLACLLSGSSFFGRSFFGRSFFGRSFSGLSFFDLSSRPRASGRQHP